MDEIMCSVVMCFSKTPMEPLKHKKRKLFFPVPKDPHERMIWLQAIGRTYLNNSDLYVCQDHFDLKEDLCNYSPYYAKDNYNPTLKPGVVPHKFKCQATNSVTSGKMEMERFKRRLIRSVARLMIHEKKSEQDVWVELKKETGCNCKLLWTRMRALTIKKLERLLAADDCIESIPKGARMSLTDWLLFDLILVHQEIDLIAKEKMNDPKPLEELFELVKKYDVEQLQGDDLAEAWSLITLHYNKQGHQCSPMLLQRRWYQMKESARDKFYQFWNSYRGVLKRLNCAEPFAPTPLQTAIARWKKTLVTSPFVEWEELIKKRLVIMPDEFDRLMKEIKPRGRSKKIETNDDETPDLELIEPDIETIDLGIDSDQEGEEQEESNFPEDVPETSVPEIRIKEEPIDIHEEEITYASKKYSMYNDVLMATSIDHDAIDKLDEIPTEVIAEASNEAIETITEPVLPQITNVFGNVEVTNESLSIINALSENTNCIATKIITQRKDVEESGSVLSANKKLQSLEKNNDGKCTSDEDPNAIDSDVIMDDCTLESDNIMIQSDSEGTGMCVQDDDNLNKDVIVNTDKEEETNDIQENSDPDMDDIIVQNNPDTRSDAVIIRDDPPSDDVIIQDDPKNDVVMVKDDSDSDDALQKDFKNSITVGNVGAMSPNIPIVKTDNPKNVSFDKTDAKNKQNIPDIINVPLGKVIEDAVMSVNIRKEVQRDTISFSFGELSNNISFVDDGIEFVDDGIAFEDENDVKEPVVIKTEAEDVTSKICEKLEMIAIVYTTKLEDMGIFHKHTSFDHIENKTLIDLIASKSKPILPKPEPSEPAETPVSEDVDTDEMNESIPDSQRVKLSSYMLQKPRSRVYNPIQLCKNPDFNTRLKRLTVGFLSSPRNRVLLKTCMPVTIDLSKAFENKLVAGTLYLKESDTSIKQEVIVQDDSSHNASVVPSAMPAQSLIDNSEVNDILPMLKQAMLDRKAEETSLAQKHAEESNSLNERSKTINLPDIREIRRINQTLLTAEVTPIQMNNFKPQVPVSIVTGTTDSEENTSKEQPNLPQSTNKESVVITAKENAPVTSRQVTNRECADIRSSTSYPFNRPYNTNARFASTAIRGAKRGRGAPYFAAWKPRCTRPLIPWFQNVETPCPKKNENLLTLDTLNKMLYHLNKEEADAKKPKVKKKKSKNQCQQPESTAPSTKDVEVVDISDDVPAENCTKLKPIINVISAANNPNNKNQSVQRKSIEKRIKASEKNKFDTKPTPVFCCWARHRMCRMLYCNIPLPPHECPYPLCTCCCKKLLDQFFANEQKLKNAELERELFATNDAVSSITFDEQANDDGASVDGNCVVMEAEIPATDIETPLEIDSTVTEQAKMPIANVETPTNVENVSNIEGVANVEAVANVEVLANVEIPVETAANNDQPSLKVFGTPVTVVEVPVKPNQTTFISVPVSGYRHTQIVRNATPVATPVTTEIPAVPPIISPVANPIISGVKTLTSELAVTSNDTHIDPDEPVVVDESSPDVIPIQDNDVIINDTLPKLVSYTSESTAIFGKPTRKQKKKVMEFVKSAENAGPYSMRIAGPADSSNSNTSLKTLLENKKRTLKSFKQLQPSPEQLTALKKYKTPSNFKEKMIYLNSKLISERPTENPMFLDKDKNKILLTTVKFPHNLQTFEIVKQNLLKHVRLPVGVQLVLQPNSTVTYSYEDNVILTAEEEANMSVIVSAVQNKINEMAVTPINIKHKTTFMENEIVNLDDDDDSPHTANVDNPPHTNNNPVISNENLPVSGKDNNITEDTPSVQSEEITKDTPSVQSEDITKDIPSVQNENVNRESAEEISKATEVDTEKSQNENLNTEAQQNNSNEVTAAVQMSTSSEQTQENENKTDEDIRTSSVAVVESLNIPAPSQTETVNKDSKTSESNSGNKTKNILSDLMEMSGIFEEDITPVQEQTASCVPETPLNLPPPPQLSAQSVQDPAPIVNPNVPSSTKSSINELSPITSLLELKYACQNNGSFFKLDFKTGYLVPINVCMKSLQKSKPNPLLLNATKSVIDLTEEDEPPTTTNTEEDEAHTTSSSITNITASSSPESPQPNVRSLLISSHTSPNKVKPLKLFKSVRSTNPGILRRSYTLGTKPDEAINKNVLSNKQKHKRKQFLQNNEATLKDENDDQELEKLGPSSEKRSKLSEINKSTVDPNCSKSEHTEADGGDSTNTDELQPDKDLIGKTDENAEQSPKPLLVNCGQVVINTNYSDDDSDDEPLANIAKRQKEGLPPPELEVDLENHEAGVEEVNVEEADEPAKSEDEIQPMDVDHYELYLENSDDEDDMEENCILGV